MIETEFPEIRLETPNQAPNQTPNQIQSAIALLNSNFAFVDASDSWFKLFNLELDNIKEKNWFQIFPNLTAHWRSRFEHALHGVKNIKIVDNFEMPDGTVNALGWSLNPWKDSSGKQFGISVTVIAEPQR